MEPRHSLTEDSKCSKFLQNKTTRTTPEPREEAGKDRGKDYIVAFKAWNAKNHSSPSLGDGNRISFLEKAPEGTKTLNYSFDSKLLASRTTKDYIVAISYHIRGNLS